MGSITDQDGNVAQVNAAGELVVFVSNPSAGGGGGPDPVSIKDGTTATQKLGVDASGRITVNVANPDGLGLTDAQLRAAAVPVSGPLTDAQLRLAPVPVSGPLTDTQLRAAAVPVSGPLTDAQLRATAVPVSGFPASQAVTGPLTDAQLRATPVPVSGTVTATGPLTDAQLRAAAVPVDTELTLFDLDSGAGVVNGAGVALLAAGAGGPVVITGDVANGIDVDVTRVTGTVSVTGPLTDTQLRATAVPVSGPLTDAQLRATRVPTQNTPTPSNLAVTATGAAAAAVTLTLPLVTSQFHYITYIEVTAYSTVARVGGVTPVLVTSTNLPGSPVLTFASAAAVGTTDVKQIGPDAAPLKSSVAGTATTIVCPATTSIIWRVNVFYYAAA